MPRKGLLVPKPDPQVVLRTERHEYICEDVADPDVRVLFLGPWLVYVDLPIGVAFQHRALHNDGLFEASLDTSTVRAYREGTKGRRSKGGIPKYRSGGVER